MKLKTKEEETGQLLIFEPSDDVDIFLLGRIAAKIKHYTMEAVRTDQKMKLTKFSIKTDDLLKLLERTLSGGD